MVAFSVMLAWDVTEALDLVKELLVRSETECCHIKKEKSNRPLIQGTAKDHWEY